MEIRTPQFRESDAEFENIGHRNSACECSCEGASVPGGVAGAGVDAARGAPGGVRLAIRLPLVRQALRKEAPLKRLEYD